MGKKIFDPLVEDILSPKATMGGLEARISIIVIIRTGVLRSGLSGLP